jgi:8-amino-7-oxononanoate synthase
MADIFDFEDFYSSFTIFQAMQKTDVRPFYRTLNERDGTATVDGNEVVMAGSSDYLSLHSDPRVTGAAIKALEEFGTSSSGARAMNGTRALHAELEARLAAFLGTEAAAVTPSGLQANQALSALLNRNTAVFSDAANHASLVDGIRLSGARRISYRHSDMEHLAELLARTDSDARSQDAAKVIVTDGLFSMDGDMCRLPELLTLARRHGARVIVDGAHDIGVLGPNGRGVGDHFGLQHAVDLYTGSLAKTFASTGGFLAGPAHVIEYLRWSARSILFSGALPPAALAAAGAVLDIIETEPWRRRRATEVAERLRQGLRELGFDTGHSTTPVIPVRVGEATVCTRMWQGLLDAGVFTNAVGSPAVPEGRCVIRITAQAAHTDEHITRILDAFASVGSALGVIPTATAA